MNLVNISHKIMIVSAIVSTLITTLAFFFFVINEVKDDLQQNERNCMEPFWCIRLFERWRGSCVPHHSGLLKEHLENPPKISRLNSLGPLTLRKIKFFLKATKYETIG